MSLSFEVEITGRTTEVGYFTIEDVKAMDLMDHHRARIQDAFQNVESTFIR